jgi:phytoene desaturase
MYRIHFSDGTVFHKYADEAKQIAEIERHYPGESAGFQRYMRTLSRWFEAGKPAFLEAIFLRLRELFRWSTLRVLSQMRVTSSVLRFANEHFQHPNLRAAFSLQTLYIGGTPKRTPALYSLIPYAEHAFGIWYVRGGYASLMPRIETELRKRDVQLRLGTKVDRLLVEEGRCVGVEVGGVQEAFDAVIFNGDFPSIAPLVSAKIKPYTPSSACLLIYLGVDTTYTDSSVHQFVLPDNFSEQIERMMHKGSIPQDVSYYTFNPSLIDDGLAPEGHSVLYMLVPVPSLKHDLDWATLGEQLAERVIADAEARLFPDLRAHMRWKHIRTPQDATKDGLYLGGSFGIAPTLFQSAALRPQVKPFDIEHLYAVGASVHPGGGVPIVMQGAKLVVDTIDKEANR